MAAAAAATATAATAIAATATDGVWCLSFINDLIKHDMTERTHDKKTQQLVGVGRR